MIFQLDQANGGIDKIYEVPLVFLENAQTSNTCSTSLFPIWFRPVYTRCSGVKEKFKTLFTSFKKLNKSKQRFIIDLYRNSRQIESICSDEKNIYPIFENIDPELQIPLKSLFEFLFNETIGTTVFKKNSKMSIDDHYTKFQEINNVHVCPFCGLEAYTLPAFRRAEYDHYLPISIYPWLGVNLNNLVPMGDHCNGKKNAKNILYFDKSKKRRNVWYPYEWINYDFELKCIKKPSISDMKGEWKVVFKAHSESNQNKITTWLEVFEIPNRYSEAISIFHKKFIEDFAHKNDLKGQRLTLTKVINELKKYRDQGIGDSKLETMAQLKFIWANYYINVSDQSQLALLTHVISRQIKRTRP